MYWDRTSRTANPTQLVYLLSAIDHHKIKIDFHVSHILAHTDRGPVLTHCQSAPTPAGRNQSGCSQKMGKIKKALQAEIDAVQKGKSIDTPVEATPKKAPARKRKSAADDENGETTPKKRGRPVKKDAALKVEEDLSVKDEPESGPAEDEV